jgi:hypothetical protein
MAELLASIPPRTEPLLSPLRIRQEQLRTARELRRRVWLKNPEKWVYEKLCEDPWSIQVKIMRSVVENRSTAVPSCFGSGKSWIAARLACYWIDVHPPGEAFVVTSARSFSQVKAILWKEIHRAHSAGKLRGRLNKVEWWLDVDDHEEMVAYGRKPDDLDPTAFQGIHERYVLVILDEAAGISTFLAEAASSLIVNEDSRLLMIGNPEDNTSEFADACKPGSGWNVIQIKAWDTPNFSGEEISEKVSKKLISSVYVEEKRKRWGPNSPMWQSKIEAEFPDTQEGGLIPIVWVRAAQERVLKAVGDNELGVDVGGGGDRSVIAHRHGPVVRIVKRDHNPDTMETCGNVIAALKETRATKAKVDTIGIGRGIVDRGDELKKPIEGVNVAMSPGDDDEEDFVNLRAKGYWNLRERFQNGDIDIPAEGPEAEDLAAQLISLIYKRTSKGKIQIESKDEMKRRGIGSPDEADAVMLAFLKVPKKKVQKGATWGK